MTKRDLHRTTITKLTDSEVQGGSVQFEADEAEHAGAFFEDAIDETDLEEDTQASER